MPWEVMPDLFFYRDPEEVEKEEFKTEDKKEAKKPVLDDEGNEIP